MPLSCCAPDMRSMRNGGDEAPKMQAAHRQVGRKDLQRPSYILTRNTGIFRGFRSRKRSDHETRFTPNFKRDSLTSGHPTFTFGWLRIAVTKIRLTKEASHV